MTSPELAAKSILMRLGYRVCHWHARCCLDPSNTFYEQFPITSYILDFAMPHAAIDIEIDGFWHSRRQKQDRLRDLRLISLGWKIIRLSANLVLKRPEQAGKHIQEQILSKLIV